MVKRYGIIQIRCKFALIVPALVLLLGVLFFSVSAYAAKPDMAWNHTYRLENDSWGNSVVAVSDGYVVTGWLTTAGADKALLLKTDLEGRIAWQKTFGRNEGNIGRAVRQTRDGGYIIVGETSSSTYDSSDIYLVKTDSSGNEAWNSTYGGAKADWGYAVWPTSDGGYVIAGATYLPGHEDTDIYLLKVDEAGAEQWSKTFGGPGNDQGMSVQQTRDGGYIVAGDLQSSSSCYLVKTDGFGNELWNKTVGRGRLNWVAAVSQTRDGGYILTGSSGYDLYLAKIDPEGREQWIKTYGGDTTSSGADVLQTADGGYLASGYKFPPGNHYSATAYLVKTDENGSMEWSITGDDSLSLGGDSSLQLTPDGGAIFVGSTTSYHQVYGRLLTNDKSYYQDMFLLKLNNVNPGQVTTATPTPTRPRGIVGGSVATSESCPVVATGDGYVVGGTIRINKRLNASNGWTDFNIYPYLTKADLNGNAVWFRVFDNVDACGYSPEVHSVAATGGGYLVALSSGGPDDGKITLIKADQNGSPLWTKVYGEPYTSYEAGTTIAVKDGYLVAGSRYSPEDNADRQYLLKTDPEGNFLWLKTYAGLNHSIVTSLTAVEDGYFLTGIAYPDSDQVDGYLLKTDLNGNGAWNRTLSWNSTSHTRVWTEADSAAAVKDGYAVSGVSWMTDSALTPGVNGAYLAKIGLNGNITWDTEYSISGMADSGEAVAAVKDGYALAGIADYYKQVGNRSHIFLLKTNPEGGKEWNVTFTGGADESVSGLLNLSDGYLIVGQNNLEGKAGKANQSLHLIRTDMSGNVVWDKTYANFTLPANSAGQAQLTAQQILIATLTPIPIATQVVNVTPTARPSPAPSPTLSPTPGFSSEITAIALLVLSLAALSRPFKGGDRK